jgi:hypothetical protein
LNASAIEYRRPPICAQPQNSDRGSTRHRGIENRKPMAIRTDLPSFAHSREMRIFFMEGTRGRGKVIIPSRSVPTDSIEATNLRKNASTSRGAGKSQQKSTFNVKLIGRCAARRCLKMFTNVHVGTGRGELAPSKANTCSSNLTRHPKPSTLRASKRCRQGAA